MLAIAGQTVEPWLNQIGRILLRKLMGTLGETKDNKSYFFQLF